MATSTSLFDIILLHYSDEYTIRNDIYDRITRFRLRLIDPGFFLWSNIQ